MHHQAARIHRQTGNRHSEAIALSGLGNALHETRRFDEAITAHQQAATIFQETDDRHGESMALDNLALTLRQVRRRRR